MRPALWIFLLLATCVIAKRRGGGSGSRGRPGGFGSSRPRTPAPPPKTDTSNHFLDSERASSSGTTHYRPDPFKPSAPQIPKQSPPQHTNGPIGFENVGGNSNQGNHKLGFDKVNSEVQNKPSGSYNPSAPNYPQGPPPAYYPGTHSGGINEHPPAYPGRPVGAPPSYSANNPYNQNNPQPGFGSGYPQQGQGYHPQQGQGYYPQQGQGYHPQQNFGNNYGSSYPQQNHFGNVGPGSFPPFGNPSYPGHTGYNPGYGSNSFGNSYQGNTFGGSPFGNTGYNSNPYYNPNNFGYSNNPGYFGSQGGYNGYQKKSGFGGLPIPIPIPIPIPFGGGGFGGGGFGGGGYGGGGFGGYGSPSYHHRLLDTFIKDKNTKSNNSTSVFILNNSTVTPCTTDHFIYPMMKVTVDSCTAEFCTAVKITTTTNVSNVESVHSAGLTMCLEQNATFSYHGVKVTPTASEMVNETLNVCRDVPTNVTTNINVTLAATAEPNITTTDATTTTTVPDSSTASALNATVNNTTRVCEDVNCWRVQMCMPAIEIVDSCNSLDCPFRRTGYKPCVTIKTCRSPSTPISTFATLNTTVSKIDEYNRHQSVYEVSNLTLISYHRPVIVFNCSQNVSSPGCPPPAVTPQLNCPTNSTETVPGSSVLTTVNSSSCTPTPSTAPNSTVTADPGSTTAATSLQPSR